MRARQAAQRGGAYHGLARAQVVGAGECLLTVIPGWVD